MFLQGALEAHIADSPREENWYFMSESGCFILLKLSQFERKTCVNMINMSRNCC